VKTIDERLVALTHNVELMAAMQQHAIEEEAERRLQFDERFLELGERQAEGITRQAEAAARHDQQMSEIRSQIGRAVRLSIQEARNERKRRQDLESLFKAFLERSK
jgi:hypothetical protein